MLKTYRAKRDFSKTPEPSGNSAESKKKTQALRFVVQEHAATRLHFDFRLEFNGILLSWAVPKGPSSNPKDKRLAVMTEDHPLDYAGFEGIIPSGYGAGEVIVWDKGTYVPLDNNEEPAATYVQGQKLIREGLKTGKISFQLLGEKLKGIWTLVRIKAKEKDWLLIKNQDQFSSTNSHPWIDQSILSGKTLSDLQSGEKPKRTSTTKRNTSIDSKSIKNKTASKSVTSRLKKKSSCHLPVFTHPMLATLATDTFIDKNWSFEPKLDGIRALAYVNENEVHIYSRRGHLISPRYPALCNDLMNLSANVVLDGEIIALDKKQRPSFEKLQERSGLTKSSDIAKAEETNPVIYYVFDILYFDGEDVRTLALSERRRILNQVLFPTQHVQLIREMGFNGEKAFKTCVSKGFEGVVSKRLESSYQSGRRSSDWLKIKNTDSSEFLICGYTAGTGSRQDTFGALILGEHNKSGKIVHVGNVGTGFNTSQRNRLLKSIQPLISKKCPFLIIPDGLANPTWLKPRLVAEIKFAERTKSGHLRVPVFMHLRDDIDPAGVSPPPVIHVKAKKEISRRSANSGTDKNDKLLDALDNSEDDLLLNVEGNDIALSHLNKIFWPTHGGNAAIRKRDYIRYLIQVAPYLLPHLQDRILTLIRFPQGIAGVKFFQKHWQENRPAFVQTVNAYTEHDKADQTFLLCNNLSTLVWLGQIADLELHTSHTRISKMPDGKKLASNFTGSLSNIENSLLNYPDYLIFDLDPYLYSGREAKGSEPELHHRGFQKACQAALWLKELFDQLSIEAFVKTSGRTGLHIYVPIERNIDYDSVRSISQHIGQYILAAHKKDLTMDWSVSKRTGKVFLDHNMNARSKSLASIYSARIAKEASVSTPVRWDELENIYPTAFTIATTPARLHKIGDLWYEILSRKNNIKELLKGTF